ncbi:MAG: hypothetical protein HY514_02060 [Candidatus Aenigmarchaeota archaeon]|nr:hypothetical protein [Candidatus Aenigmarchaeota archaeon]
MKIKDIQTEDSKETPLDRIVKAHRDDVEFLGEFLKILEPYEAELSKEPWQLSFDFMRE